jgi:hypothetical protein
MSHTLGRLLGLENVESIDSLGVSLAARWAEDRPFWLFVLAVGIMAVCVAFYWRWQQRGSRWGRLVLGVSRGLLLLLLSITLADPILQLGLIHEQRPLVYLVFDGTDSMAIADDYAASQRAAIAKASGGKSAGMSPGAKPTRLDYVRQWVASKKDNPIARLTTQHADVEAFIFDGNATSQLRKLRLSPAGQRRADPSFLSEELKATGQVTALGSVLEELGQQFASRRLQAVVLVSDFDQNSGPLPLGGPQSPAERLGVPIYTVGVGVSEAIDLAVELETDPKMKKGERSNLVVRLRQTGLENQSVNLRVTARRLTGDNEANAAETVIGQRTIALSGPAQTADFPFTPEDAGRYEFAAIADKPEGDVAPQNNQATRQLNIIDDHLRLMYVAYEPTWEWRFVKEVFHRDKLVGLPGFRTFLSSSDPRVRESNPLFLPTLTPKRSDFFANDVLFLDDMPRSALNDRFCELTRQYVSELGGGLVVIAGPRFGPRELYQTPLADMLPVIIDPSAEMHSAPDQPEFRPRQTPHARRYPFMQLGADEAENARAWETLGKLPWYQPVAMPHPQAEVLLEHPTDKCADGKTPQPLIAIRPYGKGGSGEVVWVGFNEMWRLRRQYGETYYRQFWSQLIYRLGMSHALGADKRFVVRLDQPQYRALDKATLSVEAYDENYDPLMDTSLTEGGLNAELTVPSTTGAQVRSLKVPMLRKGAFEIVLPLEVAGDYRVRVQDPVTGKYHEQRFEVTALSVERRRGVRDERLQQELAEVTGGKSYDLATVDRLLEELKLKPTREQITRNCTLWTTPLWFGLIVILMLGEWAGRKIVRLP